LRVAKAARRSEAFAAAARRGVEDAFAAGITTVADTGDSGAVLPALVEMGGSGIVYQEVFGPDPLESDQSLGRLRNQVATLREAEAGRVRLGVSPHAPYTVSAPLYRAVAALAAADGLPVAVHLAESADETALVTRDEGAFAMAWRRRRIPSIAEQGRGLPPEARRSPVAWLDALGVLGPRTLCIHCVQLDPADIERLAATGASVAHCPVSNRRHGHGDAPLAALLAAGVPVGGGTDSVLSVGRLDLNPELRAARDLAGLSPRDALALATTGAARALGLDDVGALVPGAWADLVAFGRVPAPGEAPESAVLAAGPDDVLATWVGGRAVYRRGEAA
jgi:5-methylthioadenosine/S-adenosylhomocysteine deaminase